MRLSTLWFVFLFCLCSLLSTRANASEHSSSEAEAYLNTLLRVSEQYDLAAERTWQVLLHYRTDLLGSGVTSEIDDGDFFFSETGNTNPKTELEATLRAFFSNKLIGKQKMFAQCAFPARYAWLNSQLVFDLDLMPSQNCERLNFWRNRINAESVSLIFSSYYLNNPASMFGHTLLRFNSVEDARPSLLDFAINYSAVIEDSGGFFDYIWSGTTGGFEGRFSVYPYYDMVKLYNDIENRDLWEYKLNISPKKIDFMLMHVWELIHTRFDFYFLRENCSYHLLSLLEAANPEFKFRDEYLAWTLPTDTIKQISEMPGLVGEIVRRPSLRNQLENMLGELNKKEKKLVKTLVHDPESINSKELAQLLGVRLAAVIDTAIAYSQYVDIADSEKMEGQKRIRHHLLVQRSKLDIGSTEIPLRETDEQVSPDQGHDPFRFSISTGNTNFDDESIKTADESFIELSLQAGFHDLLSREQGHAPDSQIRFLALTARYGEENEEWRVQELALIDIVSLYPVSSLLKEPSWKLNIEWERNQDNACADCTPFIINPGIGIALESNLHRKEIYYGFLEVNLEFDHELESGHRGGFGATAGLLFDASDQWRIGLTANRTRYTEGARSYVSRFELQQRFYHSRNLEFVFNLTKVEQNEEGKIGFAYYF